MALDPHYTNSRLAALYDLDSPWGEDTDFYIALAGPEPIRVADIGCGTGTLACGLVAAGHEVVGIEPAVAMLDIARQKPLATKIEWHQAFAAEFSLTSPIDLMVMTGHAFQVLQSDEDILAAFDNFYRHLKPGGQLVFESRNPDLDWDHIWDTENRWQVDGSEVTQVRSHFARQGEMVRFRHTFEFSDASLVSDSTLRFASKARITALLESVGFELTTLYGDWHGKVFESSDKEMIFVARRPE